MTLQQRWRQWEEDLASSLSLRLTTASGSKWHDPGDAVTPGRGPWPCYAEAKYTEAHSYRLTEGELRSWTTKAAELGKRLVVGVRFAHRNRIGTEDYVVLTLHDFKELLDRYRDSERALEEGDWA